MSSPIVRLLISPGPRPRSPPPLHRAQVLYVYTTTHLLCKPFRYISRRRPPRAPRRAPQRAQSASQQVHSCLRYLPRNKHPAIERSVQGTLQVSVQCLCSALYDFTYKSSTGNTRTIACHHSHNNLSPFHNNSDSTRHGGCVQSSPPSGRLRLLAVQLLAPRRPRFAHVVSPQAHHSRRPQAHGSLLGQGDAAVCVR